MKKSQLRARNWEIWLGVKYEGPLSLLEVLLPAGVVGCAEKAELVERT